MGDKRKFLIRPLLNRRCEFKRILPWNDGRGIRWVVTAGFVSTLRGNSQTCRNSKNGKLRSVGIQCALCHSTVDDSFARGIGRRLDAWPNRDLDIGAIINFAPNLQPFASALRKDEATV